MKETSQCSCHLKPMMLMTNRFDLGHDDIAYHVLPINTMVPTDSSHLHDPYRYASCILGEEPSCRLKRIGAAILKVILTSSYFDGPNLYGIWVFYYCWFIWNLKLRWTKKILQNSFKMALNLYYFLYALSRISEGLLQNQLSWIPFCPHLPDFSLEMCLLTSHLFYLFWLPLF